MNNPLNGRRLNSLTRQIQISRYQRGTSQREEILALLAESVGQSTESALAELVDSCKPDDYPAIWIASGSDRPIGVMRLDSEDRTRCTITHIAVDKDLRSRGVGRLLIEFILDDLGFRQVEAETDDDARGFYEACGFIAKSIGENRYGIQRYRCLVRI